MRKKYSSKIILGILVCFLYLFTYLKAQSSYTSYNHWIVNGQVNAITNDANYVYVGGNFIYAGPPTGCGAKITTANTNSDLTHCKPNGKIFSAIPDGLGGWYIGGNFSSITTSSSTAVARNNIAHILSTGQLDMIWDPNANASVAALVLSGSDLYVGGSFTNIGGQVRNNIAKLTTSGTGTADANWNPNANASVAALVLSGSDLYVGGSFTNIGGQTRNKIAKLNATGTGVADVTWDPNANSNILALVLSGNDLYVGGDFTSIGGQSRNRIARLSATGTGIADATWNPNSSNVVTALVLSGSDVYVGGSFTIIGGEARNYLAKLSVIGTGAADATWNPDPNGYVYALALSGSDLYVGGSFIYISGQTRNNIAKLNTTGNGAADVAWDPKTNGTVRTLAFSGSDMYVGGDFKSIGGLSRNKIVRFNKTTGAADAIWNPDANASNSYVNALAISGSNIYVGGSFSTIGGQVRNNIAKLSTIGTGAADANWNPNANSAVNALALSGSDLYAGGDFLTIGGQARNRIAKLDAAGTGTIDASWNPNANYSVRSLVLSGSDLYVGGDFSTIGGQTRNSLAKLSTIGTGAADLIWNPNPNNFVNALALSGNDLYVGGSFSYIGAQTRKYIAKLTTMGTGTANTTWNPNANDFVWTIALSGNDLYLGGRFTNIGGQARKYIAKLNSTGSGTVDATWNPSPDNYVNAIAFSGSDLYVGGTFGTVGGDQLRNSLASISISCVLPTLPVLSAISTSLCAGNSTILSVVSGTLNNSNNWQWYNNSCGLGAIGSGTNITISPSVTTTYYARGEGGCVGNSAICTSITITVNATPTISVNSGSICSGNSFTISPSGAYTYTYSSGSDIITPLSDATVTVTGTDINGCIDNIGVTSTIIVNTLPVINISGNNPICEGNSITLTASGADSYLWSTGVTTQSFSTIPTVSTIYTVTGTNLNNCSTTQTVSVTVDNTCQDVWPGDANSDGTADNLDVLELGLHYTQTGLPRASVSNIWQSYHADNWTGTITNGENMNHSDCNGDGTINDDDTLAIYNNYGLTHAFKTAQTTTVNPQLSIVPDQAGVLTGNWGSASIYLGDATNTINNINGIAFTVDFDNTLIETNNVWIEYPTSFINASNQNLHFRKLDFGNNSLYTATTHTVTGNVSGNGLIAILHYQIKSGLTTDQVLNIGLSQANRSDATGSIHPLTVSTGSVLAVASSVGLLENIHNYFVSIHPNPTNGELTITSKTEIQKIEVVAITGQILLSEVPTNVSHALHLDGFANGIYFVNLYQNNRIVKREKVVLNK